MIPPEGVVQDLRTAAKPLAGRAGDYDALLELIGDARVVLIGEATHGTEEFYRERAEITKRLVAERGFAAVAVEADWPHALRVDRFVRGRGSERDADDALRGFQRFPTWMWRNTVVLDFVTWLREHNDAQRAPESKVGFYGLDLYSLHESIHAVIGYLERVDADAARRARSRYSCFDHAGDDPQDYAERAAFGAGDTCEAEAVDQLLELQRRAAEYARRDGRVAEDEAFYTEQNARVVKNAEEYYRSMFGGRVSSWNLRDRHMAGTLDALVEHLGRTRGPAKIAVWEHNSHVGDARATQLGEAGELNVGQLARDRYGRDAFLVGFSTYSGTVTAASDWGAPAERKRVRPALEGSYEDAFHAVGVPRFWVDLHDAGAARALGEPRLERAIGVIYRPETERLSHYFYARLPQQFDAVLHLDETSAVEPLERTAAWEASEAPETFPTGL